jgi:hypothetical protein
MARSATLLISEEPGLISEPTLYHGLRVSVREIVGLCDLDVNLERIS